MHFKLRVFFYFHFISIYLFWLVSSLIIIRIKITVELLFPQESHVFRRNAYDVIVYQLISIYLSVYIFYFRFIVCPCNMINIYLL